MYVHREIVTWVVKVTGVQIAKRVGISLIYIYVPPLGSLISREISAGHSEFQL
jgi:hypothetical protein